MTTLERADFPQENIIITNFDYTFSTTIKKSMHEWKQPTFHNSMDDGMIIVGFVQK